MTGVRPGKEDRLSVLRLPFPVDGSLCPPMALPTRPQQLGLLVLAAILAAGVVLRLAGLL
jgi:hypothetical protein